MHAYIRGTGLELMTNSDNLLRCGLTAKHIDSAEMLSILAPSSLKPEVIHPELSSGFFQYRTSVREFELRAVAPEGNEVSLELNGPAILFGEDGRISVQPRNGETLELWRGKALFAAAAAEALRFSGSGRAYIATVAECDAIRENSRPHDETGGRNG
jgi:mannose-6-phosphate isomerase